MRTLLLSGSVAFLITFFVLPAIIKIAAAKQLFDLPDARKLHQRPVASLGGVGMFIGFFLTDLLLVSHQQLASLQYYLAAALVIFFLGLKDDILIITPLKKFLGQVLAAAILIHLAGLRIHGLHGLFGVQNIPAPLEILLSYATIILVINAYNLIDGIDGLAGALGLLNMGAFGLLFLWVGDLPYGVLAFAMGGSLLAFLLFNHQPAKIFMGDSGSMAVGLFNAIFALRFLHFPGTSSLQQPLPAVLPLVIAVLAVPLVDTIRVFSIRLLRGRSPFAPDRNHVHHLLLKRGLSHRQATYTCVAANAALLALALLGQGFDATILLLALVLMAGALLAVLVYPLRFGRKQGTISIYSKPKAAANKLAIPGGAASAA
ncbi:UDP-N-acetylmuramyl pentapeptide phosphotransferase/UDP-N-acetylglucosamine-1-phosphate transferase [Cnuella takakiae]|uniref:UDP-N-acetylmuramyl pentapeptide phosphotransferase/UDP-N-acetylglucosamine-1-phosphate transferase n=1 Tax=Cnuella takakiae TaxID=1302690 RepID=A0A1M4WU83_9BACT|nr:MraY family glycosyltransferase [Cnuella takakiae]OLY91621.1 hypothetical protein BUE76_06710 [Cnuella takakiae]SHE84603.1 UDP-N-acetylmuramyl pentapeptide phosphotransferase/UDP-N-acetylglucosamine-1-phosphate transferase [Cnuella takakiae]